MDEAGVAVGGFYKHFTSREDLVLEALAAAIIEMDDSPLTKQRTLKKTIGTYLSRTHRDNLEDSCPVAALIGDVSRNSDGVRKVYTDRVERSFAGIAEKLPDESRRQRHAKAILIYSACVGAIGLSRAVSDADLSDQILKTVAKQLSDIFGKNH
jgi:TetR/AcrR family transcriptional repressor of nem operon